MGPRGLCFVFVKAEVLLGHPRGDGGRQWTAPGVPERGNCTLADWKEARKPEENAASRREWSVTPWMWSPGRNGCRARALGRLPPDSPLFTGTVKILCNLLDSGSSEQTLERSSRFRVSENLCCAWQ